MARRSSDCRYFTRPAKTILLILALLIPDARGISVRDVAAEYQNSLNMEGGSSVMNGVSSTAHDFSLKGASSNGGVAVPPQPLRVLPIVPATGRVVSLPAPRSMPTQFVPPLKSVLPPELLPDLKSQVKHRPADGTENAAVRPKCHGVLKEYQQAGEAKGIVYNALCQIVVLMRLTPAELSARFKIDMTSALIDKKIKGALSSILDHQYTEAHRFPWYYMLTMKNCAVDEKGRTFLMKLFEFGYTSTLAVPHSVNFSDILPHRLLDTEMNNILHLAVFSGSEEAVKIALGLIPTDMMREFLDKRNHANQTPLDIAYASESSTIVGLLKTASKTAPISDITDTNWAELLETNADNQIKVA